jgi:hypothetical protein
MYVNLCIHAYVRQFKLAQHTKRLIFYSHVSGTERVKNKMYHSWLHVINTDFSILAINYEISPTTLQLSLRGLQC